MVAQFQSLMDENQNRKDLELNEETQVELIDITNESVEHDTCCLNNANPKAWFSYVADDRRVIVSDHSRRKFTKDFTHE